MEGIQGRANSGGRTPERCDPGYGGRGRVQGCGIAPPQCIQSRAWQTDTRSRGARGRSNGDLTMSRAAPDPLSNMGKPEPRLDGRLKVTGEARYGSDFVVSNPAYAFLVTSPIAKGRIESMDLRAAKAVPGVLEIFNYENTGELKDIKYAKGGGGPTSSIQGFGPLIQYGGQIVALVVADTFEAAREAAHMVRVNYKSEAPSATFDSRGVSESAANEGLPQAGDAE